MDDIFNVFQRGGISADGFATTEEFREELDKRNCNHEYNACQSALKQSLFSFFTFQANNP